MKRLKRVLIIALCICMLMAEMAFAATPNANIITPVSNSVVASSDLSVFVKVLNKKKITVSIFEEKEVIGTKVADGVEEEITKSINVKDFTTDMVKLLADQYAEDKAIELSDETSTHVLHPVMVGEKVSFSPKNNNTCFSKVLKNQNSGLYMIQVDVLGEEDAIEETYYSFVALLEKPVETQSAKTGDIPIEIKTSLVQIITELLKVLIK